MKKRALQRKGERGRREEGEERGRRLKMEMESKLGREMAKKGGREVGWRKTPIGEEVGGRRGLKMEMYIEVFGGR